jgi:sulfide:quinone oxidoreductase
MGAMSERANVPEDRDEPFSVLIAGGGVAGLEAVLALREATRPSPVSIEVLSPTEEFEIAPLSVAEPFGAGAAPRVRLEAFCKEHSADFTLDALAEIWPDQRRVLTERGVELPYDALLLCPGARRRTVISEALTFRGGGDSAAMEQLIEAAGESGGRIVFVVPAEVNWPLPLYELALLVADRLRGKDVELVLVTHESEPLEPFGGAASTRVAEILVEAGIQLRTGESLESSGERPGANWLVTLPRLEVPEIPGLPQASHGFVPTDSRMRVPGLENVWAVGDVTWSPLKQGGIAAQQADIAAADIANAVGVGVEIPPYVPVLRAALLTAEGPYYLRAGTADEDGEQRAPLWWPPAKVAGRLLAPFLAKEVDTSITDETLVDLEVEAGRDENHEEALDLALQWADVDAERGELRRALHWLDIAEGLNIVVPDAYREKRRRWREELGGPDA